eukprot:TRINITY_DN96195_c0_g1_i1.p1 TRINITY_DN96195_c0_g1~~TRINITY_DN96195_c0_g1_i1.p1  ORF type:complete len:310 (+),score=48.49 TRINITY_DN96195_c0_g1_i1:119-931(+)
MAVIGGFVTVLGIVLQGSQNTEFRRLSDLDGAHMPLAIRVSGDWPDAYGSKILHQGAIKHPPASTGWSQHFKEFPLEEFEKVRGGFDILADDDFKFIKWKVKVGDEVKKDDVILLAQANGTVNELKAGHEGLVRFLGSFAYGNQIPKGTQLAYIGHPRTPVPILPPILTTLLMATLCFIICWIGVAWWYVSRNSLVMHDAESYPVPDTPGREERPCSGGLLGTEARDHNYKRLLQQVKDKRVDGHCHADEENPDSPGLPKLSKAAFTALS